MSLGFALGMFNPLHLGFGLSPADENLLYYFPYLIATDAPLNEFLATLEYVLLLFVGITDGGPEDEGYKGVFPKVWTTISCLLSFALISGALYASFTDVGRDTISGVQYRFWHPSSSSCSIRLCAGVRGRTGMGSPSPSLSACCCCS